MQYTNKHQLPDWLVKQLIPKENHPPLPKRMSVTSLIHPPRMRTLLLEKWDDISVDVSELLNFFDGNNLDAAFSDEIGAQEKMELEVDGVTIVGKLDLVLPTSQGVVIVDTKRAKVGIKGYTDTIKEWERQLNCYSYLYTRIHGQPIVGLENHVFYKDHTPVCAANPSYPPIAYEIIKQPLWSMSEAEDYIKTQLEYHASKPMDCPQDVRWGKWKVKSEGRKTAHRVCDTFGEAVDWMNKNGKGEFIEQHDCIRCRHFCAVRSVCPDALALLKG